MWKLIFNNSDEERSREEIIKEIDDLISAEQERLKAQEGPEIDLVSTHAYDERHERVF